MGVENYKIYYKYLKEYAERVDTRQYEDYFAALTIKLNSLGVMDIDDDLFIKRANESLVKTIEFANLCYIMANEGKIEYSVFLNKFVRLGYALDKVVQRAYDIEDEDECFKLAEKIDDTVDTLGSAIIVQDAKYWTCLVKTFKLGDVEEFEERIKTDINNAPTEPETEEVDFVEKNYDLLKSVFESAIENKLDAISPTWVMRNFFVGYNKSVLLLECLAELGYLKKTRRSEKKVLKSEWTD